MDKAKRIHEIEGTLKSIAAKIDKLESDRSAYEYELNTLNKHATPEDKDALLSEKRMAAWRRQVVRIRGLPLCLIPPSQWWVPLAPDYLGGGEPSTHGIGPRITLCIRPDGQNFERES